MHPILQALTPSRPGTSCQRIDDQRHFSVAFSVGYLMSGSIAVGGAIALVEPAVNTVAYFFHEKAWARYAPPSPVST